MLTVRFIAETVAEQYGVSYIDLISARRTEDIVLPRWVAIWMARQMTLVSQTEVGQHFGGRDHSTVIQAVRKINQMIDADTDFRTELNILQTAILTGAAAMDMLAAKLPGDINPVDVARRVISDRIKKISISCDEVDALALAVIAAENERHHDDLPSPIVQNVIAFLEAEDAAKLAAGTEHQPVANLKRDHAVASLRHLIEQLNGESNELAA